MNICLIKNGVVQRVIVADSLDWCHANLPGYDAYIPDTQNKVGPGFVYANGKFYTYTSDGKFPIQI